MKCLVQFSEFKVSRMFFVVLLGFRLGLNDGFVVEEWFFVLEHLHRCYIEYYLNTRIST